MAQGQMVRKENSWEIIHTRVRSSVPTVSIFFFSSRRRHTRFDCDWSSDVCSSDLLRDLALQRLPRHCEHRSQRLPRNADAVLDRRGLEISAGDEFAAVGARWGEDRKSVV